MARRIIGQTAEGTPIYGEGPDAPPTVNPKGPIQNGAPIGSAPYVPPQASTPMPSEPTVVDPNQPRRPLLDDPNRTSTPRGPLPTGPIGATPQPSTPITAQPAAEPWVHPGNRRWREARDRGITAAEYQAQGAAPVPNTAALNPATQAPAVAPPPVQTPTPQPQGKPPLVQDPYARGRVTPQPRTDDARVAGQRQYLRGQKQSTF